MLVLLAGCGEKPRTAQTMVNEIEYTKDTKTELCFAVSYPFTIMATMTTVPCEK